MNAGLGTRRALRYALALVAVLGTTAPVAAQQASPGVVPLNMWREGDPGERLFIDGRVTDSENNPVAGARLYFRQADGTGEYRSDRYRAVLQTDDQGRYAIGTVLPGQYYGVKHIHVRAEHEFFQPFEGRILFKGDPNLSREREHEAVFLEKAGGGEGELWYGRYDIQLKLPGQ